MSERDLTCPRCGEGLDEPEGGPPAAARYEQVRETIECPKCGAPLEFVMEAGRSNVVDIWIEDRRSAEE